MDTSSTCYESIIQLLETQLAQGQALLAQEQMAQLEEAIGRAESPSAPPGNGVGGLRHFPHCENLAAFSQANDVSGQGDAVRPPCTPPPSPSLYGKESATEAHAVGFAAEVSISDGRWVLLVR